jgi:hypothetical protein
MPLYRTFLISAFAFAFIASFTACTTESGADDEGGTNVYAHLVNDWQISAATVTPVAQLPTVPGVPSIPGAATTTANLMLLLDACEKVATLSFRANGLYIRNEGAGCDVPDSATWVRTDSIVYIDYQNSDRDSDTLTIVELSASVFKAKERNADLPDRVVRTISWTLIPR